MAVAHVAPEKWWRYAVALFEHRIEFSDIPTSNLTPVQLREKLADFGLETGILTQDEVKQVKELLTLGPSGGIAVTDDLKYCCKPHSHL